MSTQKNKKGTIGSPKGMRDIIGEEFYTYQGFFEKASEVAHYYGFKPIKTPLLEKEELFISGVGTSTDIVEKEMYTLRVKRGERLALRPEGTAPIVRAYIESGMHTLPQPVLLYYYGPFFRHDRPQRGRYREFFQFGLEALGTTKSVIDAMIIQVTSTILGEAGCENLCVRVNTIGDKECRPNYIKELVTHYRKHINALCSDCRQRIKGNPLRLLDCKNEQCAPLKEEAPQMIAHVCGECKEHFREVLEYLETMSVHYEIDHTLVRGLDYYSRTVFEIGREKGELKEEDLPDQSKGEDKKEPHRNKETGVVEAKKNDGAEDANTPVSSIDEKDETPLSTLTLASGGRYDYLGKQLGSKKDIPAVGVAIGVDRVLENKDTNVLAPRILKRPKIYFIQIGFEAKMKSLAVIEVLRKARVPIVHSLSKDKLSVQLAIAEKSRVPYTIIIGQREALENAVIVRNMANHSQDTIPLEKLATYLKKKL